MTGTQFKEIRRWNRIPQQKIANAVGWRSIRSVNYLEAEGLIADKFVNELGKLIGKDLTNEKNMNVALEQAQMGNILKKKKKGVHFERHYK